MHWQRWRKWGDPRRVDGRWKLTVEDRFWAKVDKSGECWLWTGAQKNGYGCFWLWEGGADRMVQAHRYAYELVVGPIPAGMTLDHICHTRAIDTCRDGATCPHRACVRPDHLHPLSLSDNIKRGGNATKTHCKRGHEFTEENTYVNGKGYRWCRVCQRIHAAEVRARKRQVKI